MSDGEVLTAIADFNRYAAGMPWLDIDVVACSFVSTKLHCGLDLTASPDVEITFDSTFFVSLPMSWKTNTSRSVLELVTGEEAIRLNMRFRVEQGHHLFAFRSEDLAEDVRCLVFARAFSWRQVPRSS